MAIANCGGTKDDLKARSQLAKELYETSLLLLKKTFTRHIIPTHDYSSHYSSHNLSNLFSTSFFSFLLLFIENEKRKREKGRGNVMSVIRVFEIVG